MATAMLHRDPQRNFAMKDSVTVIGKAITARDYASKKDRARAACHQKDSQYMKMNFTTSDSQTKANKQESIVTNCGIYNASGDPMKIVCTKEWNGEVRKSYPQEIGNGQWGLFVHTKRAQVPEGSKAAVVYRIKNANGEECDWISAWDNPRKKDQSTTHAYTEIREVGHFADSIWPEINEKLKSAGHECDDTQTGCIAEVSITEGSPAHFEAVITLEN